MERPADRATLPGWKFLVYQQDHDQIGNRAVGDRISSPFPGSACRRRDPGPDHPLHPDAVHGRGVGREHAVAVLHQPPRSGAGQGHGRGPDRRVRRARLGRRRRSRPAGPGDLHAGRSSTGRSSPASRTSGCWRCTGRCWRCRAHPDLVDADLSAVQVNWDDADNWMVVHRGSPGSSSTSPTSRARSTWTSRRPRSSSPPANCRPWTARP